MAIQEIVAQAKQVDVYDLISRYVSLSRVASGEWEGACPQCGGNDRLHCTAEWWFCRQCHTKRGDSIEFMRFVTGCTFQEATERLTSQQWPERKPQVQQPKAQRVDERDESWFDAAAKTLRQHQIALPGSKGAEYLKERGLAPATWAAFGLGYAPTAKYRDVEGGYPAIAMPWYRGGKLTAIRYRFLNPPDKQKITSLPGSKFGGVLFGSQGLPEWVLMPLDEWRRGAEQNCTLVLCEGEINAMSIWQVAHETNLQVMSMGSESGRLSAGAVAFAERYGKVIIWMDKPELAKQAMEQIPNSYAYTDPDGRDANDLHKLTILGSELTKIRWRATATESERWRLIFDLWDAANQGSGLDRGTAAAYNKLCGYMGRYFDLMEHNGLWLTPTNVAMT